MKTRPSARLVVIDARGRVLLFRFEFPDRVFWAMPGGAVDKDESFEQAAQRELLEETGIRTPVGRLVHTRRTQFAGPDGDMLDADERYFLVRTGTVVINTSGWEEEEAGIMSEPAWLMPGEIELLREPVYPEGLSDIVRTILADGSA